MKKKVKNPVNANAQQHDRCAGLPVKTQLDQVRRLNLEADIELQRGHHAAAERLSHRAAQIQGWS